MGCGAGNRQRGDGTGGRTGVDKFAYTVQIVETLEGLASDLLAQWERDAAVLVLGLLDELQQVHAKRFEPEAGRKR